MLKSEVQQRWKDERFVQQNLAMLRRALMDKASLNGLDLRGIIVGLADGRSDCMNLDFQETNLRELRADWGKFSCSFVGAQIKASSFKESFFDTCRFKNAHFSQCEFNGAKFASPHLDDGTFQGCDFGQAKMQGRGAREYGGRRILFDGCRFNEAVFQNLQFRSTTFRNCSFGKAMFKKCYLAGIKFEGTAISLEQLEATETQTLSLDGNELLL